MATVEIESKRVTIMLDSDISEKLHNIQAKEIKETSASVSFSKILNDTLRRGLKA